MNEPEAAVSVRGSEVLRKVRVVDGNLARRLWRHDRTALGVAAFGLLVAAVLWQGVTRPMADTVGYRAAADLLTRGWPTLPDRTPGYPALLVATGSTNRSTSLLFVAQLAMHAASIALVIDLARRFGAGRRGRILLAALLVTPPVLLRVVYEGTECIAALLVTSVCWLVLTPPEPNRRLRWAAGLGLLCAAAALVRPTFVLLFVPVALVAWWQGGAVPRHRRNGLAASVAAPVLVIIGGLTAYNAARFDTPSLTPLTPYHLASRTSAYVEDLPPSYEPARSVLVDYRDRALLKGEQFAPANYIWSARPALQRATGLHGPALNRYVMQIDLYLISRHPFDYLDAVKTAAVNYSSMDSQPAILGLGRPAAWVMEAAHDMLLAGFLAVMALTSGLILSGRVPRRAVVALTIGLIIAIYTEAVSIMVETGTARLRAPVEPILALVFVIGLGLVHQAWMDRQRSEPTEAGR